MAETYHVLNWRELPLSLAATLASGLDGESRTKRKLRGEDMRLETILQTAMLDQLRILSWYQTEDSRTGKNAPKPILSMLRGEAKPSPVTSFASPEEFMERRRRIIGGS